MLAKVFEIKECETTMDLVRDYLDKGTKAPFIIRTDYQTKGRGQYGRSWIAPRGKSFLGTYVVEEKLVKAPEFVSFSSGIALVRALETFGCTAKIVWPNDLQVGSAKLGGVLVERYRGHFLIGLGINVNDPLKEDTLPDGRKRVSLLALRGEKTPIAFLLKPICEALEEELLKSSEKIFEELLSFAGYGDIVHFQGAEATMEKIFPDGTLELLLKDGKRVKVHSSGEFQR